MHHSYRITMHAQNGARALTRGQNLAGIWIAWHEDAELLAAEEPHQCPGIRPATETCIARFAKKCFVAFAREDQFILAEAMYDIGQ